MSFKNNNKVSVQSKRDKKKYNFLLGCMMNMNVLFFFLIIALIGRPPVSTNIIHSHYKSKKKKKS